MCRKKPYSSKKDALTAKNSFKRRDVAGRGRKKLPVRVYECPDCGYWHLTSRKSE